MRLFTAILLLHFAWSAAPSSVSASEIDFDASLQDLSDVTVETASRTPEHIRSSPGIVSVITQDEIVAWGALNLSDVLSRVAGTQAYPNPGLTRIGIRGNEPILSPENILFLVNGKQIRVDNGNLSVHSLFYTFPLTHVERIEIIRGPGSVLYGTNAVDGVINIITRASGSGKTILQASQGDYSTTLVEVSSLTANEYSDVAFGGRFYSSKRPPVFSGRSSAPDSVFALRIPEQSISVFGRGNLGKASMQVFLSDNEVGMIDRVPTMEPTNAQIDFISRVWHASLAWKDKVSENAVWDISYTYNFEEFEFELGNARALYWQTQLQTLESSLDVQLSPSWRLHSGAMLEYSEGLQSSTTPLFNLLSYRVFSQAEVNLTGDIKATLGLQANADELTSVNFAPRLGINAVFEDVYIKAFAGRGYRAPLAGDRYIDNPPYQIGKKDLSPELATTFSTQIGYHASSFYTALTAFHTEKTDGIVYSTSLDTNYNIALTNAGESEATGLELEYRTWFDPFVIDGSVVWYQHTQADTLDHYTLTPSLTAKLGISFKIDAFEVGLHCTAWTSPHSVSIRSQEFETLNPEPEGAVVADLRMQYNMHDWLGLDSEHPVWVSVYVDNVLNTRAYYPDLLYFTRNSMPYEVDRTVHVGIRTEI